MGILKIFNREIFRLKSRRTAFYILKYVLQRFLFVIYMLGLVSLAILPHPLSHEEMKEAEKALLLGQVIIINKVNRLYTDEDTRIGKLPDSFQHLVPEHRAAHLQKHMEDLGFDTSLQKFTIFRANNTITGTNVHGILRAPRGEGTEALVLSAPHYFDKKCIYLFISKSWWNSSIDGVCQVLFEIFILE